MQSAIDPRHFGNSVSRATPFEVSGFRVDSN